MQRTLASIILVYASLSAAQWGQATRSLHGRAGELWCGNVVSDPFLFLVNVVGPLALVCAAGLAGRWIPSRRCSSLSIAALFLFLVTTAGLVSEGWLLERRYGIDIRDGVWWFPRRCLGLLLETRY